MGCDSSILATLAAAEESEVLSCKFGFAAEYESYKGDWFSCGRTYKQSSKKHEDKQSSKEHEVMISNEKLEKATEILQVNEENDCDKLNAMTTLDARRPNYDPTSHAIRRLCMFV